MIEGNQFWRKRTKHGRDKLFADSGILKEACEEYFDWVEDNPLWESKVVQCNGEPVDHPLSKMRAMTIGGLCVFLGMTQETWGQYRKHKDFSDVITEIEAIIRDQKFTGAAAGLLNPNIIARDLGLKDESKVEHEGLTVTISKKDSDL